MDWSSPPTALRQWRLRNGYALEDVCDLFEEKGLDRPSISAMSRLERGLIPLKRIPKVSQITGIPAHLLRPDLARLFGGNRK